MRTVLIVMSLLLIQQHALNGQQLPPVIEEQIESLAQADNANLEDESLLQDLEEFRKHPLNLNSADQSELNDLRLLSDLQISQLLLYRKQLGQFISIYELQAIPSWDISTIKKLLPFIEVSQNVPVAASLAQRFRGGDHSWLLRVTQLLEPSKGYLNPDTMNHYEGSPQHVFTRYRYNYRNELQWGFTADKDAGEQMWNRQWKGFDFLSVHFFARRVGIFESVAIGDYTVQLGQGLLTWQGMAFNKSADIASVQRQSSVLRPYTGSGEYLFNRGVGVSLKRKNVGITMYVSSRRLGATITKDNQGKPGEIETIQVSGYHRTVTEINNRNNLLLQTVGVNVRLVEQRVVIGASAQVYRYSLPLARSSEVYCRYDFSGAVGRNLSVDYSYTFKNVHVFGEAGVDEKMKRGIVNGMMLSVDPAVDLSIVSRQIQRGYSSLGGNAFAEFSGSSGECGLFAGMSIRPAGGWRLDGFVDLFRSQWLRYRVNAPSTGTDFMLGASWKPDKKTELVFRYRQDKKDRNISSIAGVIAVPVPQGRQNWRFQFNVKVDNSLQWRNRLEYVRHRDGVGGTGQGFLQFTDLVYKPLLSKYSLVSRLQYFETDDYDSRLYAYENDVLYKYAVPAFSGKGWRYYIICDYQVAKKLTVWVRWARTWFIENERIGSGLDEVSGSRRTECTVQMRLVL